MQVDIEQVMAPYLHLLALLGQPCRHVHVVAHHVVGRDIRRLDGGVVVRSAPVLRPAELDPASLVFHEDVTAAGTHRRG